MTQTWDPLAYARNGAFVHGLAGGVLEWLNADVGEFILDLGCGDGQLTQRIAACEAQILGVDASAEMVAAARERGVEAELANAESMRCFRMPRCTGCVTRMRCSNTCIAS